MFTWFRHRQKHVGLCAQCGSACSSIDRPMRPWLFFSQQISAPGSLDWQRLLSSASNNTSTPSVMALAFGGIEMGMAAEALAK